MPPGFPEPWYRLVPRGNQDTVTLQFTCNFRIVNGIPDQGGLHGVQPRFGQVVPGIFNFAAAVVIAYTANKIKIWVNAQVGYRFYKFIMLHGRNNGLAVPFIFEFFECFNGKNRQSAGRQSLQVQVYKLHGYGFPGFKVKVETNFFVILNYREGEHFAVRCKGKLGQFPGLEHRIYRFEADVGIVEQGAVPVPYYGFLLRCRHEVRYVAMDLKQS